jgi:hypothetical protein
MLPVHAAGTLLFHTEIQLNHISCMSLVQPSQAWRKKRQPNRMLAMQRKLRTTYRSNARKPSIYHACKDDIMVSSYICSDHYDFSSTKIFRMFILLHKSCAHKTP